MVVLLGAVFILRIAAAPTPDAVMRQALGALASARLAEAAELIQGNEGLLESPLALGILGQILECEGREAEALEVYFLLHARLDGYRYTEDWIYGLIRENWLPPSLPAMVPEGDASLVEARLVALASRRGEEEWERVVAAIPALRETDLEDWREAIAAFPPADPGRLVPKGRSAAVEDWLEFLKWQPSNEVVVRLLLNVPPDIEWDEFSRYLLARDPEMSLNTEVRLRAMALRESDRASERFEELAGWVESLGERELAGLTAEAVGVLLASLRTSRYNTKERAFAAMRRVVDRLLRVNAEPDFTAELLMVRGWQALEIGSETDSALDDANAAAEVWAARSATIRREGDVPPYLLRRRPIGNRFLIWGDESLPEMETVPPASLRLLKDPIDPEWAARLKSPVLRVMAGDDREIRWKRVVAELATEREEGEAAVVRDLRRLLWSQAPWEGDGLKLAIEDCEKATAEPGDVFLAFEAAIWRSRLAMRRDPEGRGVSRTSELVKLQDLAETLLPPDVETGRWANRLMRNSFPTAFADLERIQERAVSEPLRSWLPLVKEEAWLARGALGVEGGMSDLVACLHHSDSSDDAEEGLRVSRLLHERFPHRTEWAVELALRSPDDKEAFRLLDDAMPTGEAQKRAAFLATSALRLRENSWKPERRDAAALRIARWEKSRRPSGDRRWLREVIPMLADFSPGHQAWEMLFDGAGSAEGAFDRMLEQGGEGKLTEEERLGLARRVLLSGAYARDESPWIDRARFFDQRVLPRPHSLRGTAKALPELVHAWERLGTERVFPGEFLADLATVDPVTAAWLHRVLAGDPPAPRFVSDAEWFGRGQGPDRRALGRQTMPAKPERSVLKFAIPWHERARFEAAKR